MPLPLLGAALGAASNLLGFGLNTWAANDAQNRSMDMVNHQHDLAIEDWNRQNAYNSPAAQMGRFKDAGLNPNLVYGQMSNSPTIRSSDGSGAQAAPQNVDLGGGILKALQAKQSQQQAALLAAETYKTTMEGKAAEKDADLKDAQINNLNSASNLSGTQAGNISALQAPSIEKMQAETAMHNQSINESQARTGSILQATDLAKFNNPANLAKTWSEVMLNKANASKIPAEIQMFKSAAHSSEAMAMLNNLKSDLERYELNQLAKGLPIQHDAYWQRMLLNGLKNIEDTLGKPKIYRSPLLPR